MSLSQSHIAKGPEIEARHRLVPAAGIMRLVAGQARLLRQWSFACIGVTNDVCFVCACDLRCWWHGMAWLRYADDTSGCVDAWSSLDCKCVYGSVGEALALAVVLVWEGV